MRSARVLPIRVASFDSGVSISYCSRAVEARVEPRTAPRRSRMTTERPASVSCSAAMAPLMPAPMTRASQRISLGRRLSGKRNSGRRCQIEWPDRRFLFRVAPMILGFPQNKGRPKAPFARL